MKRIPEVALQWILLEWLCKVRDSSVHSWMNSQIATSHQQRCLGRGTGKKEGGYR